MAERFVDVSYRGLELGRRLKLRDLRPDSGWIEIPLPMPVGTTVEIATDEGVRIAARVAAVHEQVGGSDRPPGMEVRPALEGAAAAWWQERVDTAPAPEAPAPAPVAAEPAPAAAEPAPATPAPAPEIARATIVMSTDQVQAALAAAEAAEERSADDGLVDDGRRTTVMSAIDISMITGEPPPEVGVRSGRAATEDPEITIEAGEPDDAGDGGDGGDATVSGEIPVTGEPSEGNGRSKGRGGAGAKRKRKKR